MLMARSGRQTVSVFCLWSLQVSIGRSVSSEWTAKNSNLFNRLLEPVRIFSSRSGD